MHLSLIYNLHMPNIKATDEIYISVDVETAGPNPAQYSLLTIGACTVLPPNSSFYVEIKPVNTNFTPKALEISHLSMELLAERGKQPEEAMRSFEGWLKGLATEGRRPLFVAFNAGFDWMFVNDYFHRYLGRNPFGHAALDVKSLYMGLAGVPWSETSMKHVGPRYLGKRELTHHALRDAMDQAEIFKKMLEEINGRKGA